MRHTILASLAAVSLGGAALAVPGIASAAQNTDPSNGPAAVMGPAEDYQYGLTVNGVSPTLRSVVVDGESILAYCIEYWVQAADPDHRSAVTGWDAFTGDNNFKTDPQVRESVAWILRNSHPTLSLEELADTTGARGLTEAEAVAATQAAIWHFTDDFVADGDLTVDSAAHSSQSVSAASAHNVQTVFDYFTGPENIGLSEQEVQASVTLVDTTDAEIEPAETVQELIQDEHDHLLGPVALNASTEAVDLELTSSNSAVEIADITMVDAAGDVVDTSQPVHAEELWIHVPADTETGGVQITAESTDFGYTGRLITPEADDQQRFQTIVMVDETTHQATTELELNWEKTVVPPPEPADPPTEEEPPAEEPPAEEGQTEEPPAQTPAEEPVHTAKPAPAVPQPEPVVVETEKVVEAPQNSAKHDKPVQETQHAATPDELAKTGGTQTRNILVALATLVTGAALLVLSRARRKYS